MITTHVRHYIMYYYCKRQSCYLWGHFLLLFRPSKKETSFPYGLFLRKREALVIFYLWIFFTISFEDGCHDLDAKSG